jgi:hypothetical protein
MFSSGKKKDVYEKYETCEYVHEEYETCDIART